MNEDIFKKEYAELKALSESRNAIKDVNRSKRLKEEEI